MRYKGNYQLRTFWVSYSRQVLIFHADLIVDPETYSWDPLNEDLRARLDLRKYVSMSRERRLHLHSLPLPSTTNADFRDDTGDNDQLDGSNSDPNISADLLDYIHAQDPEWHLNARSIFEAETPGAMKLEEFVQSVDLGKWNLKLPQYPGVLLRLEDLQSWAQHDLSEPGTLKGCAAELAAVLGPELVQQTVFDLS